MKIRLKRFNTLIDTDEHSQEVQYFYSIEDSTGLLEINLNIPEESDPVEYFVIHIKDLYKGYTNYNVYHGKWKYTILNDDNSFQYNKIKMY